ncbi:HlyD family efflux transporter periplasmic adaptor subunit [Planctomycetales bacterium 10988]|nr:HlyD family efflux transporter periplasmic adaptor subunit [Planctomycetales bacterium 10988]
MLIKHAAIFSTGFLLTVTLCCVGQISAQSPTPDGPIHVPGCLVSLVEEIEVPAKEAGVIAAMEIKPGMIVEAGQQLAQLEDEQTRYEKQQMEYDREIALRESENDIAIRLARKTQEVAKAELYHKQQANMTVSKSVSQSEIRQLMLAVERTKLQIEESEHKQELARMTAESRQVGVQMAELRLQRHLIKAPIPGVVAEVFRRPGEWVAPGDTILKIYRIDRVRIEGFLSISEAGPEILGNLVNVTVELPGRRRVQYPGKIVFVSPEVEPVRGELRVWAEVENANHELLPGLKAEMQIQRSNGYYSAQQQAGQPQLR